MWVQEDFDRTKYLFSGMQLVQDQLKEERER